MVAIIAAHVLAFLGIGVGVFLVAGGSPRWYTDGGIFMHVVAMLAVGQLLVGVLLSRHHLHRPLPLAVHFIFPAAAALIGIAGTAIGIGEAFDAVLSAPPDVQLPIWTAALSIADLPRQFGFLVAGCGALPVIFLAAVSAPAPLAPVDPKAPSGSIFIGLGMVPPLIAGAVAWQLRGELLTGRAGALLIVSTLMVTAIGAIIGLGTRWLAAWAKGEDRANAFGAAAMMMASAWIAIFAFIHGVGRAGLSNALEAIATAPPDMKTQMLTAVMAIHDFRSSAVMAQCFALAVAVPGGIALVMARRGAGPWLRERGLSVALGLITLIAVLAAHHGLDANTDARHHEFMAAGEVTIGPESLVLPESTSMLRAQRDVTVVALHEGGLFLNGERVGALDGLASLDPIRTELEGQGGRRRGGHGARFVPLILPGDGEPPAADEWPPFQLAVNGAQSADALFAALATFREAGVRRLALLLTRQASGAPAQTPAQRRARLDAILPGIGEPLRQLLAPDTPEWVVINLSLLSLHQEKLARALDPRPPARPPLDLTVRLDGGAWQLSGAGGNLGEPTPPKDGRFDGEALQQKLVEVKDAFPEERAIRVAHGAGGTVKDLVELADAARELRAPGGERRLLFDEVTLLLGTAADGPLASPDEEPSP